MLETGFEGRAEWSGTTHEPRIYTWITNDDDEKHAHAKALRAASLRERHSAEHRKNDDHDGESSRAIEKQAGTE